MSTQLSQSMSIEQLADAARDEILRLGQGVKVARITLAISADFQHGGPVQLRSKVKAWPEKIDTRLTWTPLCWKCEKNPEPRPGPLGGMCEECKAERQGKATQ